MLTSAELVWLLAAVAKGDQTAFERLYAATRAPLYGIVLRILRRRALADEALSEAYHKIWTTAGQFDPAQASPLAWMATLARGRAIDIARKQTEFSVDDEIEGLDPDDDDTGSVPQQAMSEELKRLLACMGGLETEEQRLLLLAYYGGWSREQLSVKFDQPVMVIRSSLHRSLSVIREGLGE
ncbi:MAG: sigma-70 family RNA polymerase sigma factor [Pseudorhodoplanes sp.]